MTTGPPLADTSDMISMHRVFREAFGPNTAMIAGAADESRVALVGTYYDNVLRLLHGHHEGEDELMTPRIVQRCTDHERSEVERVSSQHGDVLAAIAEAERLLKAWVAGPSAASAGSAAAAVAHLNAVLIPHLDEEETLVLPIAARYVTAPEWGEMPVHGQMTFSGDKPWLVTGLIREQMTAQQREAMDTHMPPPVRELWSGLGEPAFTDFVTSLRA